MKNRTMYVVMSALLVVGMAACNKTKKAHKVFFKAGEWKVVTLTVNDTAVADLPHWEIDDCKVYKENCKGEWKNDEGGHAEFIWQFRDDGKEFQLSYQAGDHGHAHTQADHEAEEQCEEFSAVYEVVSQSKTKIELRSTVVPAHLGKVVSIILEKK